MYKTLMNTYLKYKSIVFLECVVQIPVMNDVLLARSNLEPIGFVYERHQFVLDGASEVRFPSHYLPIVIKPKTVREACGTLTKVKPCS